MVRRSSGRRFARIHVYTERGQAVRLYHVKRTRRRVRRRAGPSARASRTALPHLCRKTPMSIHGTPIVPSLFDGLATDSADVVPTPTATARAPRTYDVPADARRARCRGTTCVASVYWVAGLRFPLSVAAPGCYAPVDGAPGLGVSHYVDCPDAASFSHRGAR